MSVSVPVSFIQQYDAEVKAAYQRSGSMIRGTVRTRTNVGAERIYFPKLGKGEATSKARHADVIPMNLEHDRAFADMVDAYAPEYIDELDQVKINWSLRAEYAQASASALGRRTDRQLIEAMNVTSNALSAAALDTDSSGEFTQKVITAISKNLNDNDVPLDRDRFFILTPTGLDELLNVPGMTSSDFVREQLLISGQTPAYWMGFNWMMHTGLEEVDPDLKGLVYHRSAVGHGIAQDVKSEVNYVAQKASWLVNSMMSMGATIIDEPGVFRITA
jgi:hypothetical protein